MTNTTKTKRSPVVVIMGHIDHGKSTLLDYIRNSNITDKEAGGITQHLGAYEVEKDGEKMTFIDTPGHAAFTQVRNRSAIAADIAILIISAEDGVMPQTMEAYKCIEESRLPFIVAINKIDSPKANVSSTKNSLVENGIYIEGYGGDISAVEISALSGEGVDSLLEIINLVADVEEFTGDKSIPATGVVIEAHTDKRKGITSTMIIKDGTLEQGDYVVCGDSYAPVRVLEDYLGKPLREASFSSPVKISGWSEAPSAGETFEVIKSKKEAIKLTEEVALLKEEERENVKNLVSTDSFFVLPIVIKADTSGSLEAIQQELSKLESDKLAFQVIYKGTGAIGEKDIKLASGNEGTVIVGFNVPLDKQAEISADRLEVEVATFKIIYEAIEWLGKKAADKTPKIMTDEPTGKIKVLKLFSINKQSQLLGGKVKEGKITKNSKVKILRREEEIGTAVVREIQKIKEKVNSVNEGEEFGTMLTDRTVDIAEGDMLVPFMAVEK